jgi:hypothetical protein
MGVSAMRKPPFPILVPHSYLLDELQRIQQEKCLRYLAVQFFFSGLRTGEVTAIKEVHHG